MPRSINKQTFRVIDANLNRAKEGLRVCEEIFRFIEPDKELSVLFKKIRHGISDIPGFVAVSKKDLLTARDSVTDIGRPSSTLEFNRNGFQDIFFANIQRSKESIRVLEEFSKLIDQKKAVKIKSLRYDVYNAEKKAFKKCKALRSSR